MTRSECSPGWSLGRCCARAVSSSSTSYTIKSACSGCRAISTALAREIEVTELNEWKVGAALVLDRPMVGARLRELAIPIWTHWGLRERLGPTEAAG